jgi:hypothetical protein
LTPSMTEHRADGLTLSSSNALYGNSDLSIASGNYREIAKFFLKLPRQARFRLTISAEEYLH